MRRTRARAHGGGAVAALVLAAALPHAGLAQEAASSPPVVRGRMTVSFAEYMDCPIDNAFVRGQEVMVSGGSLLPNEPVTVTLVWDDGELPVASVRATPRGSLSSIVTIPATAPTESEVRLRASAEKGELGGGVVLRSPVLHLFPAQRDSDGDGFLDHCDNCPALATDQLEDSDVDGLGDPCDECPNDSDNDSDGDGLCADVDPNPYAPEPKP